MNHPLDTLFDQFLKERRYLKNVTEATLVWYRVAFSNYTSFVADDHAPLPTKASLQGFVMSLRDRGIKPVTCNTYISAMNAFCAWLHAEGYAKDRVKVPKLRVERRLLTLLDDAHIRAVMNYKPQSLRQARTQLAVLLILDTGLRISEALHLREADIDFDNLVLKVFGKGQKERLVPFSPELRRRIFRYQQLKSRKGFHVFEEGAFAESPSICSRARTNASTDSGLPFPSFTRPRIPRCVAFVDAKMSVKEFR